MILVDNRKPTAFKRPVIIFFSDHQQAHKCACNVVDSFLFFLKFHAMAFVILQVIEFVKKHVGSYTLHLAGNSIYMDYIFLKVVSEQYSLFSHNTYVYLWYGFHSVRL